MGANTSQALHTLHEKVHSVVHKYCDNSMILSEKTAMSYM